MPQDSSSRVERRSGSGRRHDDGQAVAAKTVTDHAVAHQVLGLLGNLVIGAFGLGALWIVKLTVVPFAGHTTSVQATVSITFAATLSVGGCWAAREWKFRKQGEELKRLRVELEKQRNRNRRVKAVNAKRGRSL